MPHLEVESEGNFGSGGGGRYGGIVKESVTIEKFLSPVCSIETVASKEGLWIPGEKSGLVRNGVRGLTAKEILRFEQHCNGQILEKK